MAGRANSHQVDARTRRAARVLRVLAIGALAAAAGSLTAALYFLNHDATVVSHLVWWVLIVMAVVLAALAWGCQRAANELGATHTSGDRPAGNGTARE